MRNNNNNDSSSGGGIEDGDGDENNIRNLWNHPTVYSSMYYNKQKNN